MAHKKQFPKPHPKVNQERVTEPHSVAAEEEVVTPKPTPPAQPKSELAQLSQQFNLLLVLFVALFLFQIFTYYKIKKIETNGTGTAQQPAAPEAVEITMDQVKSVFKDGFITFGKADSKLMFLEFSDPSCPFCHIASGLNPELNAQVGDRFKLDTDGGTYVPPVREMRRLVEEGKAGYVMLYRNGHGNGEKATEALYCAYEKGKFWEAHDLLMTNAGYTLINEQVQNSNDNIPVLVEYLQTAVDPTFLTECLQSGKYADRLQRDTTIGNEFGVQGTPGFFVNTKAYPGAYSFKDMEADVNNALK